MLFYFFTVSICEDIEKREGKRAYLTHEGKLHLSFIPLALDSRTVPGTLWVLNK